MDNQVRKGFSRSHFGFDPVAKFAVMIGTINDISLLRMDLSSVSESAWCAFAPGKEAWKRDGNYYAAEEMKTMDEIDEITLIRPYSRVLSAD